MTPEQRDKLAVMAGGKCTYIGVPLWSAVPVYQFSGRQISRAAWHPETSLDACCPLFAEVERRGLWRQFRDNLGQVCSICASTSITIRYYYGQVAPADIVVAFIETMEEAKKTNGTRDLL